MRPVQQLNFWLPLRKPDIINGELGFNFLDVEIDRVVDEFKFLLVLKILSKRPLIDTLRKQIIKS